MVESDKKQEPPPLKMPRWQFIALWWLILAMIVMPMFRPQIEDVPYSQFLADLQNNRVANVYIKGNELTGTYKVAQKDGIKDFRTIVVDPQLVNLLQKNDVKFEAKAEAKWWENAAAFLLTFVIIVSIINLLSRSSQGEDRPLGGGGLLSIGRSRARVYVEEQIKVTFADVAGVDEAKDELKEIVTFLKEPERYRRLGGKLPKGILLVGPPGTGKTLLARAVAGEAGVPFFSISGSEFVELFVGVGAARVRDLFDRAKAKAPCIIFIDELDALGRARGVGPVTGGHDEKEQTLNQLLSELDGFDSNQGVVLLAATNRPEILDAALLRAGRFDRQVLVDRPDKTGRIAILNIHMRSVATASDISVEEIAAMTPGFTGADLANLVNEATLLAARRNGDQVQKQDFNAAFERIIAGLEKKNRLLNEKERKVVAYHEMGHAIVALNLPDSEPVQKVSIIPRGVGALGYTLRRPTEDRFLLSQHELENKMTVLMGGRAAEKLVFNDASTGAADDFVKATEIARNMVTRYGMDPHVGMVSYMEEQNPFLHLNAPGLSVSDRTAEAIDQAVEALLETAFERAINILTAQRSLLSIGAELLLEKETLTEQELKDLLEEDLRDNKDEVAAIANPDQTLESITKSAADKASLKADAITLRTA